MYKTYLRPIVAYSSEIFLNPTLATAANIEKIRAYERKLLRRIGHIKRPRGSFKYIRNETLYKKVNIERIDQTEYKLFQKKSSTQTQI